MSHAASILPQHLDRTAMVYIRQSTTKQLLVHQESTRRQYQLAERAAGLGWPQPRIVVIDEALCIAHRLDWFIVVVIMD